MKKVVMAIGVFDGVHRGHREIFRRVVDRAREIGGTSLVYTFQPHPARILAPESAPLMINTPEQKLELIRSTGIERCVVEHFTKTFSLLTPQVFFDRVLLKRLRACEVFVGHNFTFGVHRSGTTAVLEEMGRAAGVVVTIVGAFLWKERLVSSSQVRQLLGRGNLPAAEELLARPYFLEGTVVRGAGRGGKELGIHTANIQSENDRILPDGVYATSTRVGSRSIPSVTNIGNNPTFHPGRPAPVTVESHLLNFNRSILGRRVRVEFFQKLREEKKFSSPKALAAQIGRDIEHAKEVFKNRRHRR